MVVHSLMRMVLCPGVFWTVSSVFLRPQIRSCWPTGRFQNTPVFDLEAMAEEVIAEETEELCEATRILAFELTNKRAREDFPNSIGSIGIGRNQKGYGQSGRRRTQTGGVREDL